MNNDGLGILLEHPKDNSGVWEELKGQSCMKINDVVLFQSIKSFRLVESIKDIQIRSSKFF